MAQHDYSIANQGFPATRADINNVLSAIATNNSGTSAPSTQYAGQFWIDTTSSTWTLYIHDGADDIQFATIDTSANTVNFIDSELGDNSVTTAKIADGNVTSAKLSYPLTTFSSTGIDDNATSTAITIDSSENVGIGTNSPSRLLHLATTGSGTNTYIQMTSNATGTGILDGFQIVQLGSSGSTILAQRENASLQFWTNNTERMQIDSSGNLKFNSDYGSVETAYGCRAWVNFDGTGTPSIRDSGNVSSVTDDAGGRYNVNFSNAMPDVNYAAVVSAGESIFHVGIVRQTGSTITNVQVDFSDYIDETYTDDSSIKVVVIR